MRFLLLLLFICSAAYGEEEALLAISTSETILSHPSALASFDKMSSSVVYNKEWSQNISN